MLKQILLAALLLGAQIANADTYNLEDAGTYTIDLNTGLEWLDLSFTRGQSYNEVLNQLSTNPTLSGWRFATYDEFTEIFTSRGYGFSGQTKLTGTTNLFISDLLFDRLISNLGATINTGSDTVRARGILADDDSDGRRSFQYYGQINYTAGNFNYGYAQIGRVLDDDSGPQLGSFLVRQSVTSPVPEPSSGILMTVGLALTIFVTRVAVLKRNAIAQPEA